MREYANFLCEWMQIYPADAALAAHLGELVPEHPGQALFGRFELHFENPPKHQVDIKSVRWRLPPQVTSFCRTDHLRPSPQCLEIMCNSSFGAHSACYGAEMAIGPCS